MKNQFKWMPVYWNDEEIDTVQLGPLEFGVYMLLTSYYWRSGGPIPDSDAVLSRAARMTTTEWNDVKANVLRMFELDDGYWRSSSIDEKFKESRRISEQNSDNANKRWRKSSGVVVQLSEKKL